MSSESSLILETLRRLPEDLFDVLELLRFLVVETFLGVFLLYLSSFICLIVFSARYFIPAIKRVIWPPTADQLYQEGIVLLKKDEDNYRRAMRRFQQCIRKDPTHGWAYVALGREQLRRKQMHRCIETTNTGLYRVVRRSGQPCITAATVSPAGLKNTMKSELVGGVKGAAGGKNDEVEALVLKQEDENGKDRNENDEVEDVIRQLRTLKIEAEALNKYGTEGPLARQINVGNFSGLDGCRSALIQ